MSLANNTTESSLPSSISSPKVEVLLENECCLWIHNALSTEEQILVFQDILERSKEVDNTQKTPCMNPSPKTLLFNGSTPTLRFDKHQSDDNINNGVDNSVTTSLSSVFNHLILRRAFSLALSKIKHESNKNLASANTASRIEYGYQYDRYSVAVIRYDAPNGSFPEHIDHCNNSNAHVVLLSLGCTARFTVRGPSNTTKRTLKLKSGDILVFDPSTQAAIKHGVTAIDVSTCPVELVSTFGEDIMGNKRYGVQCRTSHSIHHDKR